MYTFSKCSHRAVLVAKFHADSNKHKLFDDFEIPECADCDCLDKLFRIFGYFFF